MPRHISDVVNSILPFKTDNIREMSPEDRDKLRIQLNAWLKAGGFAARPEPSQPDTGGV